MKKTEYIFANGISDTELTPMLSQAADTLRRGGLVVFPTETVYGLGANALDPSASASIYAAKGRPSDNPLIIHIAHPSDAERYTEATPLFNRLAERFMPGPLTVVLPAKSIIPKTVTAGLSTVAVRCPQNPIARRLIALAGVPIAAPSANLSGSPSPTCFQHVCDDMNGRVDVIIDGGECEIGLESTIVALSKNGEATLLRPGRITPGELREVLPELKISSAVTEALKEGETVLSPGMKYRHYAPNAPVILLKSEEKARQKYISEQSGKIAVLSYSECADEYRDMPCSVDVYDLGPSCEPDVQAHRLFYLLREIDKVGYDRIFAPLPSKDGVELALYNRMIRAAAYTVIEINK